MPIKKRGPGESLLKTLLNTIPDQVWLKDAGGVFIACNAAFEKFHGTGESNILGKTDYDLVDKPVADSFTFYDQKAVEAGTSTIYEEWVTPAGTDRGVLLETIKTPVFENKKLLGVLGIARDITDRAKMREALSVSEAKYRNLVEKSLVGVYIIQDNRILFANDQFCRIFDYPREEIINTISPLQLSSKEDRHILRDNIEKRINGEAATLEFTFRAVKKDGTPIYVQILSGTEIYRGKPAIIGTCLDVTKTIQAEKDLQDTNRKLTLALQASRMGTWDWDIRSDRVIWSEETLQIFGISSEAFGGTYKDYLNFSLPEDRKETDRKVKAILIDPPDSGIIQYEHQITSGTGERKWIEVRGSFLKDDNDGISNMIGICTDITARKNIEANLIRSNREKEIFLKDLKHRIKNTLGIISSLLNLEVNKIDTGQGVSREIYNSFQNSIARIESIGQVYDQLYTSGGLNNVELIQYIRDAVSAFTASYAAEKGSIRFSSNLTEFYLDFKRTTNLGLILNELLTNSIKYAYPGESRGEIRVALSKEGNDLILTVSDDGKGSGKDFGKGNKGTGLLIIDLLTEELKGTFSISNKNGTTANPDTSPVVSPGETRCRGNSRKTNFLTVFRNDNIGIGSIDDELNRVGREILLQEKVVMNNLKETDIGNHVIHLPRRS